MRRNGILLALGAVAVAASLRADAASEAAKSQLARERRLLTADASRLTDISRRLETALSELAAASRAASDASGRGEGPDDAIRKEDALSSIEQEVRTLLDRRRILAERILDRRRTVASLEEESQSRRAGDPVTGRWVVIVDPGEQRGVFRMNLNGTIVSGEYTLEGGHAGSLRGTLVNDRLRLERVDSKLGFAAIFHGRLLREAGQITGTWEATTFGTGAAGAGRWRASREEEREDSP